MGDYRVYDTVAEHLEDFHDQHGSSSELKFIWFYCGKCGNLVHGVVGPETLGRANDLWDVCCGVYNRVWFYSLNSEL